MPDLRDEFEALMPEPEVYQNFWDEGITYSSDKEGHTSYALYTADQLRAAMQSVAERAAKKEREDGAVVAAYALPAPARAHDEIRIERARQMSGPDLWAVRYRGDVLNKQGEWEWEPMPSGRDDAFLGRTRFATADEAIAAAIRAREGKGATG